MDDFKNFLKYFWQGWTKAIFAFFLGTSVFAFVVTPSSDAVLWLLLCLALSVIVVCGNVIQFFKYKNFNRKW